MRGQRHARGAAEGSARTEIVSATEAVTSAAALVVGDDDHVADVHDGPRQARLETGRLEVAQHVLGLVLEADDLDAGAELDIGQR
ncbi:MAG: hypothetical protein R2736_10450 [Solirubrobacterales bacterium]